MATCTYFMADDRRLWVYFKLPWVGINSIDVVYELV